MKTLFTITFNILYGLAAAAPANFEGTAKQLADPNFGPVPGQDPLWSSYSGVDPTFPGNIKDPILPTEHGEPAVDDVVWQNLLAAEWVIFELYQYGVEKFTSEQFVEAGYPNTTYDRIVEIRNNEAGHLRIFQNKISPNSIKPGACRYQIPVYEPFTFLAIATIFEISSMAFLTGLVQQAQLPESHAAMVAIAEVETRHETWALIDLWKENPFGGPSDTIFPYANEILEGTNPYVIPGSCPKENPEYPYPRQDLPPFSPAKTTKSLMPGDTFAVNFTDPTNLPSFEEGTQYYMTFFHGPANISIPIDVHGFPDVPIEVQIPAQLEVKGIYLTVITDTMGAPSVDTVKAGPNIILQQPASLGLAVVQYE
ncbi:hypothetical protein S40288_07412 [Stachybotrys chartarum IBT 40288]|nr:hypothetical protein S40288_07412 [Stachybotrys chartarum IBT 40288]